MAKSIKVEKEKCLACRSCELACALEHSQSKKIEEAIYEFPPPQQRNRVEAVGNYAAPKQCRNCGKALCIAVCPSGALARSEPDSPVILDPNLCTGCNSCVTECPFGSIVPSSDGSVVIKCDLCSDRTAQGLEPACVESCPTGAVKFVETKKAARGK